MVVRNLLDILEQAKLKFPTHDVENFEVVFSVETDLGDEYSMREDHPIRRILVDADTEEFCLVEHIPEESNDE
jgi:hypothetical protein